MKLLIDLIYINAIEFKKDKGKDKIKFLKENLVNIFDENYVFFSSQIDENFLEPTDKPNPSLYFSGLCFGFMKDDKPVFIVPDEIAKVYHILLKLT